MKISAENRIRRFDSMTYPSRTQGTQSATAAGRVNRDQIILDAGGITAADKNTAAEAAHKVMLEVRTATPQEKIESLKQQVRDGSYQPDAERIVSCMLLEGGYVAE